MPRRSRLAHPVNKTCDQGRQFGIFAGQSKLFRDIQSCSCLATVSLNNTEMFLRTCHFRITALIAVGATIIAYDANGGQQPALWQIHLLRICCTNRSIASCVVIAMGTRFLYPGVPVASLPRRVD
jgi:hypothetical protein